MRLRPAVEPVLEEQVRAALVGFLIAFVVLVAVYVVHSPRWPCFVGQAEAFLVQPAAVLMRLVTEAVVFEAEVPVSLHH